MKKAIIYVRGNKQEQQEILCRLYAVEYDVLFATTNLEDAYNCDCDVVIVANASRISRDIFEYHRTIKALKSKGIKIEFATHNANNNISLQMDITP